MSVKKWKQLALIGALAVGLCTGCGGEKNEYTKAGMDSIAALDYQTAMSDFEQARANEEDIRLIARGEGIVHLAMTEYGAAVESFTEALNAGDGVVEDMDYDINYYLATAFYKNEQYQEAAEVYDAILALKPNETDAWVAAGAAEPPQAARARTIVRTSSTLRIFFMIVSSTFLIRIRGIRLTS